MATESVTVTIDKDLAAAMVEAYGGTLIEHLQAAIDREAARWAVDVDQQVLGKFRYLTAVKQREVKDILNTAEVPVPDDGPGAIDIQPIRVR